MKSYTIVWLCPVVLTLALVVAKGVPEAFSENNGVLFVGSFSAADPAGGIPGGWEPLTFGKASNNQPSQHCLSFENFKRNSFLLHRWVMCHIYPSREEKICLLAAFGVKLSFLCLKKCV